MLKTSKTWSSLEWVFNKWSGYLILTFLQFVQKCVSVHSDFCFLACNVGCNWSSEWQWCFPQSKLQVSSPLNYLLVPEPCWAWGLFLPPSHSATVQHSRPNCWADRQLKKRKQNHYSGNFCSSEINSAEPPKVCRLHQKRELVENNYSWDSSNKKKNVSWFPK